jgi:hypothetical protein
VFQKRVVLPFFRQAVLGRKWETLWAFGTLELDHRGGTRIAYLASKKVGSRATSPSSGELQDTIV